MTRANHSMLSLIPFLLVGVLVMGLVYQFAQPIIEQQRQQKLDSLLQSVFPLTKQQRLESRTQPSSARVLVTKADQSEYWLVCGNDLSRSTIDGVILALRSDQGYSGNIDLLVGYDRYSIRGIRVLEHKETPGLGDQIEASKSDWLNQFVNSALGASRWQIKTPFEAGFDAISAATITSQAVINILPEGAKLATDLINQAVAEQSCQSV